MNKLFLVFILGVIANGWCATITRYVNPSSAGGNGTTSALSGANAAYASLNAWEAAEQANLTDTGGDVMEVSCSGSTDTLSTIIDGWTTGSTNYIYIFVPASDRHSGTWNTNKYHITVTGAKAIQVNENYVRIEGVQVALTATNSSYDYGIYVDNQVAGGSDVWISQSIVKGILSGTATQQRGIYVDNANLTSRIWNNIVYDFVNGANDIYGIISLGGIHYVYNNTSQNSRNGFYGNANDVYKNNIAQDCNDGFAGSYDAASNYNLSDLASDAPGANSRNSITVTFENKTGDDFHLGSGDTGAKDYGTDLSGDANLAFSDDIDGVARTGTWDIGADEFVAAGGARRVIIFQ